MEQAVLQKLKFAKVVQLTGDKDVKNVTEITQTQQKSGHP